MQFTNVLLIDTQIPRTVNTNKSILSSGLLYIQSTLVISTSVISNNRLSRREILILVLT